MPLAVVYIDELAALNFTVDYLLLSAAAALSSVYASRLRRMAGALVGAAYACLAFFLPRPLLAGWAGKSACAGIMVLCAFGYENWRRFARRCLMLSVCGALFAGFALLLGGAQRVRGGTLYADMPGIVVLALCTCAYILVEWILHFSRRTGEDAPDLVRIEIEVDGKRASFSAMRDTGNRLRDPLGGEQVLVCELSALEGVLPARVYACLSENPDGAEAVRALAGIGERRWRLVPFRTLGQTHGLLPAFAPEKLFVDGKPKRGVLIAAATAPFAQDAPYRAVIGL